MKKILVTLIMALVSCGAVFANDHQDSYFVSLLRQLGKTKNVSEVKVTRSMLGMVSLGVREKVPYFETVKGLEAIDIFTLRSNAAVERARSIIESYFWYNKNAESLITLTNDKEITYVYGELSNVRINQNNSKEKVYRKIVLFTSTASDQGKFIVFTGDIPSSQLTKIGSKEIGNM